MRGIKEALVLGSIVLSCSSGFAARAETVRSMLAAQIRSQGFACDKPLRATRNAKLSKPDHDVWLLQCENATYRIGRYPDLSAKVEQVKGGKQ